MRHLISAWTLENQPVPGQRKVDDISLPERDPDCSDRTVHQQEEDAMVEQQQAAILRPETMVEEFKKNRVTHVVTIPDSETNYLY